MKLIRVDELFEVRYGVNLELNKMTLRGNGIPFVSRCSTHNGIAAFVKPINIQPNPPHTISVAGSGSVMESFYQNKPYYSGRDLYYLKPKQKLTKEQMLFYCACLKKNKYRYNYGRQANKTLESIKVPHPSNLPDYLKKEMPIQPSAKPYLENKGTSLHDREWQSFRYDKIFDIHGGFYNKKPSDDGNGNIPFIGATEYNNGVTSWHEIQQIEKATKDGKSKNHLIEKKMFKGETYITISNNGSIGYAFYQPKTFTCSHDANPIRLRNRKINAFIAMFLISLIGLEKYRWAYGRKWRPTRMPSLSYPLIS